VFADQMAEHLAAVERALAAPGGSGWRAG
jgi:hypothetical protein